MQVKNKKISVEHSFTGAVLSIEILMDETEVVVAEN